MKKSRLFAILAGMALLSFSLFNSCEIGLGESVDTEAPSLSINNPPTSAVVRDAFAISGTWSDDGSIDKISVELKNTGTDQKFSYSGTLDGGRWYCNVDPKKAGAEIKDGKYEATVTIKDNGGHSTTSTRAFIIDNTAPVIVLQRPSTKAQDDDSDLFGQNFTLTGQAADDNNVKKIRVIIYSDPECTVEKHHVDITNVPPTISLDVAKFVAGEVNDYSKIYGSANKDGKKQFYCSIVAYDEAQRYPVSGEQTEADKLGNPTNTYYLYNEIGDILADYKVTELYSIMSGTFTTSDTARAADATNIPAKLSSKVISNGRFSLNPANNPEFKVVGREGLAKDGSAFTNPSNSLANGEPISVKVDVGLDAITLVKESLRPYLLPSDANAKATVADIPENRIYPKLGDKPYEVSGTGYTFTTKITSDECVNANNQPVTLTVGENYIIGMEGKDTKGNEVVAEDGKVFGFRLAPSGAAPIVDIKTCVNPGTGDNASVNNFTSDSMIYVPRYKPEVSPAAESVIRFTGTVDVEDGTPVVEMKIDNGTAQIIPITAVAGQKGEFTFTKDVPVSSFSEPAKPNQHNIVFLVTQTQQTKVTKSIMYQPDAPTVTLSRVEPTAYNYNYGAKVNAGDDGLVETGIPEKVTGTDTVKKFLNGKNVKLNVTIIAGSVGLNEKDANKKAKIEFIQNGVVKKTIASPTFGETDFIDTTEFAEGELLIRITAYDMAGNKTVCEDTYYVDQTTDIPVILPKNSGNSTVKMSKEEAEDLSNVNTNVYSANQTVSYKLIDDDGLASASYTIRNPSITDPNLNIVKSEEISNLNGTTDYQLELTMPETPGTYFISLNTKDINTTAGTGSEQKSKTKSFYIRVTASAPVIENVILMNTTVKGTASISPEVKIKSDQVPFTLERKVKKIVGTDTTAYPIVDAYNKTYTYDGANNTTAAAALNTASPRITDTIDLSNITESGDYVITYKVIDKNGKYGEGTKDITVDLNAPNITQVKVAGDNAYNAATWYNSKTLSLTVTAADITGETGISAVEYSTNGTTWTALSYSDDTSAYEGSAVFSEEGKDKPLYLRARDIAGNVTYFDGTSANGTKNPTTIPSVPVKIDTSAPELTVSSYQIGDLDEVTNIASTKIYVKDGVTLKLSGSYKDEQSTIDNSTLAFDFGTMGNPTIVKGDQNGKNVAQTWTATWTIDKTKTLGALTVKIKNNAGVEKTVSPFEVVLDNEYSILKNISLETDSTNTEVYKKSETEYYVNNTKPFGSSNATPKFTIAGISTDNTGVAKVTLYKGTGSSKTKITDTSSSDFSFTNLDWKDETSDLTLTLTATDIAGNENPETLPTGLDPKYKAVTLTVHFDTTAPSALHKTDTKGKDIYFRVGEQENDDITSSDSIWDNDLDKDVGGKYTSGTFGNKETIKIRGNFDETGSGLSMIYYKLYTTVPTDIENFVANPAGEADGYFSPKDASETTRRVFYTGTITGLTPDGSAGGKNYKSIASTYLTTLSGFNTGHNYLVLVAVDNVGNAAVDNINGNYYTINVDTQAPETTAMTKDIYTAATSALPLAFTVADNPSGTDAVRAGIKSVKVKMNGVADEYPADLNGTSGKYEVTIPQNKLPTVSNTYSVSVTALDNAGNSDTRVVGSVIVDKTAPSIRVTSTAGWIKNVISNASVYVNDTNGLKKNDQGKEIVTYNIYRSTDLDTEGKPKSGATSIANGTIEVNTTNSEASTGSISLNPQDGTSWIIRFTAEDIVGNKSYVNTEAYTIDRTAPEINDTNSGVGGTKTKNAVNAEDKWFNATTLTVSGNYTDKAGSLTSGSGVTRIEYTLKKANNSQSTGSWATTNGSYEANLAGFEVGTNTLELKAVDAMGNESAVTKYTVKVDTSKPSVTSGHSSTLYSNGSGTLNINATITDTGSGIQSVVLSREGTNTTVNMTNGSGDVWSADAISLISGLTSGTVSITATATDIAGNETKVAVASVMVDKAGPTININSPAANAKTASTVTVSGTASDGNGAGVDTTAGLTLYYTTSTTVGASAPTSSTIGTTAGSKWVAYTTQPTLTGQDWSCEVDTEGFTTADANTPVYFAVGGKDLSGTGNAGYSSPVAVSVDRKAPVKTLFKVDGKAENTVASTWFNKTTLNVNGTFTDTNGSGVSSILYVLDSGTEKEIPTTNGTYNTNIDGFTTGTHTLKVRAKDAAGNYSSYDTYTVKVDAVTPEISAGYTGVIYADASSCPVELTVTDGGSSGIASVTLTVGDNDPVGCSLVNGKYTKDIISLLEDGTVSVTATATDNAGNSTSRVIANVMLDTTGPELAINSPGANAKTTNSISVSGSASDGTGSGINNDAEHGITLYYTTSSSVKANSPTSSTIGTTAGSKWVAYETKPTLIGNAWTGTFNVPDAVAASGSNTTLYICVGAVDTSGSGNEGYSDPVTIVVDREVPVSTALTIDEVAGSALGTNTTTWFNNTTVSLSGTFTDAGGSGVASVKYAVKKSGESAYATTQTIASDGVYTANVKGLAAGTNTIKVWAVDAVGNESTPAEYTVKVDDKAPTISAGYTGVIYADSASCPVELTVTDQGGSNIDTVTLTVGENTPVVCSLVSGKYKYDIKDLLSDGTVSVTATAKDKAGNETSRVIANVMLDTKGPELTINTPAANAKTTNSISVSGSASDGTGSGINNAADKGITLYYTKTDSVGTVKPTASTISSWTAYTEKPTLTGQTWTGTFNIPDSVAASGSNQTLYICVGAVDTSGSGNPGYSEPVTIVVDRKAPSIASSGVFVDTTNVSTLGSDTTKWFNNTTVNLNGTFEDDGSGVASVRYQLKKGNDAYGTAQVVASDGVFSTNIKGLAAGTNTIKVWAMDTAGNSSTPVEYTVKVDAETPVITAGYTGVVYADESSCLVELTVTDGGSSGINTVTLKTDEGSVNCTKDTSTGKYKADVQSILPQGTASITATATDNAGNSTSRVIANVMKDTDAPTINITTPSANAKTSATISLSGSVSDGVGSGIKESEGITLYYTKTASVGTVTPTASTISSWTAYGTKMTLDGQTWSGSFTVPTSVAAADANTTLYLCVGAVDNAGTGNKGYSSPVTVVVDKVNPAKSSFKVGTTPESAVNTTWFNNETLNINGTFTDAGGSGVSAILYILDGGTEQEIPTTDGTFNTNIAGFTTGTHTLVVSAKDKVGNESGTSTYTIQVDMTQPVISEVTANDFKQITLANGTLEKTFYFDVADTGSKIATAASSVTAKIGSKTITSGLNGSTITVAAESNGKNRVTVTIGADDLEDLEGNNSVIVTVTDKAGNQSNSQSIGTISMDKDAPVPNFTSHQADTTVNKTISLGGLITDASNSAIKSIALTATSGSTTKQFAYPAEAGKGTITYANGQWSATLDTTQLYNNTSSQALSLSLTATDVADNTSTAVTLALTIDQNSDRPVVKFTNLVKDGSKYILKYGNAAALEGTITDDDATSAKVVKTFIASSSPISSATATPSGTTSFNAATGDYTFTPASAADGAKTVYFYIVDNNDNVFYTTQGSQLTRPYKQYKTDEKEDNAAAITYNSDSNAPLINSVQLQAYTAATANMETQVINGENQQVDTTKNGVLTSLGTNCVVGGTSKNYVDLKVSAKDANGVKGIVIKVEQGSRVTYYRSNNSVTETGVSTYANTGTVAATTDDSSNHIYTTSRINITDYVNGQVTVTVKVYDNSGLYNNQESVFVIDRNAPTITFDNNVSEGQVVYGINKITIGGTANATDVDKIYYTVTDSDTESSSVTNWIEVEGQKISASIIFGGTQADEAYGLPSYNLRKWMQTVYSYDDTYMTEHDENKDLSIHFKAVDTCGNAGYSKRTVSVVPNGDKPIITLSYPIDKAANEHPSLAGTIRVYGNAEVVTGSVSAVYVQIDTAYNGTTFNANWKSGFDTCIAGKNTSYEIETFGSGTTAMQGIKATGTLNWNLPINSNKEFNPASGSGSDIRNVAIRIYGVGKSGKVSEPVIQEFTIDPNAPHIGGTGADAGVMQLKLVQFNSSNPLTADMTYAQAQSAIANQMPYVLGQTVWVKGQWYIAASVYDDSGIATITLDENQGGQKITLVTGSVKQDNKQINTTQTEKTIFVKANDCKAAINNVENKKNFDIYIPLPTSTGSGNLEFTIEAFEASDDGNNSTEKVKVNWDNTPPKLGTAGHENYNPNAYNVQQDNGFYHLFGYATDAEGSNLVSDMKAVAFYFIRRGSANTRVYDPMWKDKPVAIQTGTTNTAGISYEYGMFWNTKTVGRVSTDLSILTLTAKDDNIHAGGFVLMGGTIYTIRSVSADGKTITLKTDAPAGITEAKFAYAMVIDNFNMTESVDTRQKETDSSKYGYGYYKADTTADDGDLMQEKWASGKWDAWINSNNIPDGPIEIHYVAIDNAQNFSTGIVGNLSLAQYQQKTTLDVTANGTPGTASNNLVSGFDYIYDANKKAYVSNNAPRIAGVTVGTDYNGNGTVEANEKQTKYVAQKTVQFGGVYTDVAGDITSLFIASGDNTSDGAAMMAIKGAASVEAEIIGGNGNIYYQYSIDGATYKDHATIAAIASNAAGAFQKNNTAMSITREANEGLANDADYQATYYKATRLPAITFTEAQIKSAVTANTEKTWFTFEFWDSTEETTAFSNSQYAQLKLPVSIQVYDNTVPNTVISPLYWKSASDNSVYQNVNGDLFGHVELIKDLETATGKLGQVYGANDDKVSGVVVFRGFAYDNKRLAQLDWAIVDSNGKSILPNATSGVSYNAGSTFSNTGWSTGGTLAYNANTKEITGTYKFTVKTAAEDGAYLDSKGHKVAWELAVDTSQINGIVASNANVYVRATDAAGKVTVMTGTGATGSPAAGVTDQEAIDKATKKPTYPVDILPYITSITTRMSKKDTTNPEVYSRTARGHYPIASDETANGSVVLHGYNLAASNADVDISSGMGSRASGAYAYTVSGSITTINNMNNNDAHGDYDLTTEGLAEKTKVANMYNRQPNTSTNLKLTDDVYFDMWEFNSDSATSGSALRYPVMHINPSNNQIGFGFVRGSDSVSFPANGNSYLWYQKNRKDYIGTNFVYDTNGVAHNVSIGLDAQFDTGIAGRMLYNNSNWWIAGEDLADSRREGWQTVDIPEQMNENKNNGENFIRQWDKRFSIALETIGIPNGVYVKGVQTNVTGGEGIIDIDRFTTPAIAASAHSTGTAVYIMYYDSDHDQIRFRYGEVPLTGNNRTNAQYGLLNDSKSERQRHNSGTNNTDIDSDTSDQNSTWSAHGMFEASKSYYALVTGKYYNQSNDGLGGTAGTLRTDTGNNGSAYYALGVVPGTTMNDDKVVMIWFDQVANKLMYMYRMNLGANNTASNRDASINGVDDVWSKPEAIYSGALQDCVMAVDVNGGIHIAAYDQNNANLLYMYKNTYSTAGVVSCVVDAYSQVGNKLTIDTALNSANKVVPYISYFAEGLSSLPKLAYLPDGITTTSATTIAASIKNGADASTNLFTGDWEVSMIPTSSKLQSGTGYNVSIGVFKDKTTGKVGQAFKPAKTTDVVTDQDTRKRYANGTTELVLGYSIKNNGVGYIETAMRK